MSNTDPHAHWITSPDGLSRRNPAPDASPSGVPNSVTVALKIGNEFAPFHPQASHVSPDYRDGWNACYRLATQPQSPVPQAEAAASFYVRFAKEWITVDEDERQAISRFVAGWYDDDAVPPPPPPQRQEAAQVEAPLISHRETVSKPGACLKVDVLHLNDAGRACLTSSLKSLPGLATPPASSRVAAPTTQAVKVPLTYRLTREQVTALAVELTHRKRTNDWMDAPLAEFRQVIDADHTRIHHENFAAFELSFHGIHPTEGERE